jgi:hypothetical protein
MTEGPVLMPVWAMFMVVAVFLQLAAGIVIIIGAIKMLRLQSYGWAMTASVLALLPFGPGGLLGLAMGIWSLVVLNRRNVKAAFAEQKLGPNFAAKGSSPPSHQRGGAWLVWAIVVICLAVMCLIPFGLAAAWFFHSSSAGSSPSQTIGPVIPIEPLPGPVPFEPVAPH